MTHRDKIVIQAMMNHPTKGKVMVPSLKKFINEVMAAHGSIMLEHRNHKLYWLPRHWAFLNYEKDCPRIRIGVTNFPDMYEYLVTPFK